MPNNIDIDQVPSDASLLDAIQPDMLVSILLEMLKRLDEYTRSEETSRDIR